MSAIVKSITRPSELASLFTFMFSPSSPNIKKAQEILKRDENKRKVYNFLSMTSRSFASVIMELDDELRDPVCLFYLILRGIDTIEDDMTIDLKKKTELLQTFHTIIYQRGWNFTGSGPTERDRKLLLDFNVVIDEFLKIDTKYQLVIADIAKQTGHGMASYVNEHRFETTVTTATNDDYDLYCHYVAGLVGSGLSSLFCVSELEDSPVKDHMSDSNAMGLFLQKINIIRDFKGDWDEGRQYWPKEIWGQYVNSFGDLELPEYQDQAYACLSAMVLNAMTHIPQVLTYLSRLRNRSVFRFCAIPQIMAIATLNLEFGNLQVYHKNIKIRKGEAVKLILACENMDNVVAVFRYYVREIGKRNNAKDPNFLKISVAVGKVEQWIQENHKRYAHLPPCVPMSNASKTVEYTIYAFLAAIVGVLYVAFSSLQ